MPRDSEFSSYVFIKNDLRALKWNTANPNRNPNGQVYTQQECLDNPEIEPYLVRQRPEYVVKVREDVFWVIEAKATHAQLAQAFDEAKGYARDIAANTNVRPFLLSGVAGNDADGYLVHTAVFFADGTTDDVTYNDKAITGFLSPDQARYLADNNTHQLNELVADEEIFLAVAERINKTLHEASINKDARATVIASVLLSMVSDTLPNFNASPDVFVRDVNNRAEDVLIAHSKREFAEQIELRLPHEESAKAKYKAALVRVFFLLRKINIKAAMNGHQDVLGKFYEVFLKYGNGAKDIGIVLTPRHITKFAAEVIDISANDVIYDPACGTGGFLVAGYDRVRLNDPSSVDMFKKHRIFGIEQQANVAALAIVNMIFRGDGKNNIINDNCFGKALQRKIRNREVSAEYCTPPGNRPAVTKVLMNPPFALKKGDEQEYKFIEHALAQMAEGGLLFTVLPISVMYSGGADLQWRKRMLSQNTLLVVAAFSTELFYPQCSVEPVIVIIKSGIPNAASEPTLWLRILNDGYRKLKRRRLPVAGTSDLATYTPVVKEFLSSGTLSQAVPGICQSKPIQLDNTALELIPQQYLDNPSLDASALTVEIKNLYSGMVFQRLTGEMQNESI
jgi:type I restriction-modification system DNA methylase subunit